jgi:hypothetical protein
VSESAATAPAPSAPAQPAEGGAPKPAEVEHRGEPGTALNRVKALSEQLKAKRAGRMFGTPKAEGEAKPVEAKPESKADAKPDTKPAAKEEKREAKPDEKAPAKANEASKDEPAADGPQRDEHGRFVAKEGDPKAPAKEESPKPSEPPPAAAKAAEKPPEAKEEPKPPPAVKEPERKPEQDRTAARLSSTLLELRDAKAQLLEAGKAAKRVEQLEGLLKRVQGQELDGEAFEEITGKSLDNLIRELAANKLKYRPKTPLAPEVRELRDRLRAMEERDAERERLRQQAEVQARGQEIRGKELGSVKTWLAEVADKFPYLTSHEDAHEQVLDGFYALWKDRGGKAQHKPDPEEVAELIEQNYSKRHISTATNKRAMMALLKDPKVRDLAIEVLGLQPPANDPKTRQTEPSPQRDKGNQSTPEEGPRTLSNKVSQDVPAYVQKTLDEEEERKALHERVRAWSRAREAGR